MTNIHKPLSRNEDFMEVLEENGEEAGEEGLWDAG